MLEKLTTETKVQKYKHSGFVLQQNKPECLYFLS